MRRCGNSRPRSPAKNSICGRIRSRPISRRSRPTAAKSRKRGSARIEQTIYVEREIQRKILRGKGGQTIKAIGAVARADIAAAVEQPVHLFLFVKVREGWGEDPERYREMGLEVSAELNSARFEHRHDPKSPWSVHRLRKAAKLSSD